MEATAPTWDPARLVFLDETGVTTNLLRRYARGPRGARVGDHAPMARWQTSTFIAGLRVTGLTAPGVIDGAMDGDSLLAYVDQILVPTLAPGDIVIADALVRQLTFETSYAVVRDGQRFLINTIMGQSNASPTTVVLNWPATLGQR